jgi:hypothetical protein
MWLSFVCAYLTFINAFMLDWDAIKCSVATSCTHTAR